jgi:hypothetical protein
MSAGRRLAPLLLWLTLFGCSRNANDQEQVASSEVRTLLRQAESAALLDQVAALQDLTVTTGEYESAMRNTAGCLRAAGFDVSDVSGFLRGKIQEFTYAVSGLVDDGTRSRANLAEVSCQAAHLDLVRTGYQIANRSLESEFEADLARKVGACLNTRGLRVDDVSSLQALAARVPQAAFSECLQTASIAG